VPPQVKMPGVCAIRRSASRMYWQGAHAQGLAHQVGQGEGLQGRSASAVERIDDHGVAGPGRLNESAPLEVDPTGILVRGAAHFRVLAAAPVPHVARLMIGHKICGVVIDTGFNLLPPANL
jgi:hypothetical protein